MRIEIDLPADLLEKARDRAAREHRALGELIAEALRKELAPKDHDVRSRKKSIRWVTVPGGLPEGVDAADRETWYRMMKGPS